MTRVCYALTLLLLSLGGPLAVTSPAQCQTNADDYGFGSRYYYYKTCPAVDGYIQTHGEDYQPELADTATSNTDLRSRSVVAVLDDPASVNTGSSTENLTNDSQAIEAPSTVTNSDSQPAVDYHGCYEEYISPCQSNDVAGNQAECPKAGMETETSDVVSKSDVPQYSKPYDAYDYGYRYGGSDVGGCPSIHDYGYRYGGADAVICPPTNTEAVAEVVTEVAVDANPVVVARDCENECYQAYLQRCADEAAAQSVVDDAAVPATEPAYNCEPAAQTVVSETAVPATEPTYSCEPYDAYGYEYRIAGPQAQDTNQPVNTEAVTVDESAEQGSQEVNGQSPYEPYGYQDGYCDPSQDNGYEQEAPKAAVQTPAQDQPAAMEAGMSTHGEPSYEVYDYYHGAPHNGAPEPAVSEPQQTVEPTPSVSRYYGRYPYGYGYEYDYEYSKEYRSDSQADETPEPDVTEAALPKDVDVLQWVDLGREFLGSVVESDLVDLVRAEAERMLAQLSDVVENMNFDQVRADAAQAMAAAVQQPLPTPSDWNDANVYLFMFDSDLNADPVAVPELGTTPWMVDDQIVDEQPQDGQNAANVEPASDNSVSAVTPINREQVLQWARDTVDSVVVAWDRLTIELQRFAGRSMATMPASDASSTQR
ncbi:MAG: hypothetical protein ACYC3X_25305 [Pirellulaceae bacterium]